MQSDILSLRASEDRTLRAGNFSVNGIGSALLFLGEKVKSIHELLECNSAGRSLFNLAKGEVDVCSGELLIQEFRVLGQLGESLAVHGILSGPTIVRKYLLKLFW